MFIYYKIIGGFNKCEKANLVGKKCLYMLVYREVFMPVLVWLYLLLLAVGKFKNGVYVAKTANMSYEDEFQAWWNYYCNNGDLGK